MKCISIIGRKRTGKTTLTASIIQKLSRPSNYIFDINNEYTRKFNLRNDYTGEISADKFLDKVFQVKNSCIVFEEATSYLSVKGREEKLVNLITRSRHTNNVILLIFHSIADLPPYIYRHSEFCCIFKTNDFRNTLDTKFRKDSKFIHYYDRVRLNPNDHYFEIFET
jgi:hypothetical protein